MTGKPLEASADRIGIANVLAVAHAANVHVKVEDGALVVRSAQPEGHIAGAIEAYLAGFGDSQVVAFLTGTTEDERQALEAIPPVNARRIFRSRLLPV